MSGKEKEIEKDPEILQAEIFEAISHPTRIRILRILNAGASGFSELKRKLGITSSGNLSHHLNKLVTLIKTDKQGQYMISDHGREALLAVELTKDNNWMATIYASLSALIFYGVFITVVMLTGLAEITAIPNYFFICGAIIATILYFIVSRKIYRKTLDKKILPMGYRNEKAD